MGLVQHPSEPLKGHSILPAGAEGLETRYRCGFASKGGMGGELTEGKARPSPISTIRSHTTSPGHAVQSQSCKALSMGTGFASEQAHCFSDGGTAGPMGCRDSRKGEGKGRVARWSGLCQGLGERIWMGSGFPDPRGFSCLFNRTTS